MRQLKQLQNSLLLLVTARAGTLEGKMTGKNDTQNRSDNKNMEKKINMLVKMADLWGDGWTRWGRSRCRAAEEQAQVEVVLVAAQDPQEFQTHADQGRHGHTFSRHLKGKMEEKGQVKHLFLFVNEPSEGKLIKKFQEIRNNNNFFLLPGCNNFSPAERQILGP